MIKVTLEFKTQEELLAFFASDKKATTTVPTQEHVELPPVIEDAPKKAPAKKKAAPKKVAEVEAVAEFDREGSIAQIMNILTQVQASGTDQGKIAELFQSIYSELGIAPQKFSGLPDDQLVAFLEQFLSRAGELVAEKEDESVSFI